MTDGTETLGRSFAEKGTQVEQGQLRSSGDPTISPTIRSSDVHAGPVVCGVYFLFHAHKLVYVGRSVNCYARIATHRTNGRAFDYALVCPTLETDAAWIEAALVGSFKPVQNRHFTAESKTARELPARVYVQQPAPPANPLMALNLNQAVDYAGKFGLAAEFRAAVKAGELVMWRKNPKGGKRLIQVGTLSAWCEKIQNERFPPTRELKG